MNRSPSSSGLLPLPGTPASSWAVYRARLGGLVKDAGVRVVVAFWLFGLINNILYVLLLSAAQDLVGPSVPKSAVLLADVLPSFFTKLVAPYFIHRVPYSLRILVFVALSCAGMLVVAAAASGGTSVAVKLFGIVLASLSSGGGELSFLGLTHYYGHASLAAWGSGTGGAGLIGAGLYVVLTVWVGLSVRGSLLVGAVLPGVMVITFWVVLPRAPLEKGWKGEYEPLGEEEGEDRYHEQDDFNDLPAGAASVSLLAPGPSVASTAYSHNTSTTTHSPHQPSHHPTATTFLTNLRRARALFLPYMLPLLLVYVAEYTINQGVAPTLLFPLPESPFSEFRAFYPFYGFLYQLGVFISRSSTPFYRIHHLYLPSLLQIGILVLLTLHALWGFIPSVYVVFGIIFWEGLLGGAVYVNTFAEIMENVPAEDREFSLGATSVSDSGGICIAGFVGLVLEVWLCQWQVEHGRDYCRRIETS
ncbi:CLN3 protein-domain-containing protein [Dichotomopilus funicola]|uniref:Protein BTN n=1 Tax=Dichotomopilus funicola TaxID=1934379 RepID=A0AAN6UYR8_9PEZI|nr:CLN3 protein-domain-containing protein [Dichotomopilus funicola]